MKVGPTVFCSVHGPERNRATAYWTSGTGTGLIALMLAQRSKAAIDAIDIEADACLQAQENAESSLFAGRINVFHSDLVDFAQASTHLYDLIVSNPPYFVDSLKCPNLQRNTARHTDTLTLEDLLQLQSQTA